MRVKYIEERWPTLMIFGHHATTGQPYVCDCNDTVNLLMVNLKEANDLVHHYNKLHQEFTAMAQAFDAASPDAFIEFWYHQQR